MFAARYWASGYFARRYWPAVGAAAPVGENYLMTGVMGGVVLMSSATQPLLFRMVSEVDQYTPVTGLSPTVLISKNGGSFTSPAGAVTEISNGWYKVAGNATDTNTLGPLVLHATGTGAAPYDEKYLVIAADLSDTVRLGLTALPDADAGVSGGLPTGNGLGQVTAAAFTAAASQALWDVLAASQTTPGSLGKRILDNLNAAITTVPTAAANADAIWDEALAGHVVVGSAGAGVSSASSAGDPWATDLPGAYADGTAGDIIGNGLEGGTGETPPFAWGGS